WSPLGAKMAPAALLAGDRRVRSSACGRWPGGVKAGYPRSVSAIVERLRRTPSAPYAVAVLCAVVGVLARMALDPVWGMRLPLITLYPAVAFAAWFGGFRPGLVATMLCAIAGAYYWFPPTHGLRGKQSADLIALAVFVGIGVLFSALNEALHRAPTANGCAP